MRHIVTPLELGCRNYGPGRIHRIAEANTGRITDMGVCAMSLGVAVGVDFRNRLLRTASSQSHLGSVGEQHHG